MMQNTGKNFNRFILIASATFLIAMSAIGCTPATKSNCSELTQISGDYVKQLRWREIDQALLHVAGAPVSNRTAWKDGFQGVEVINCSEKEMSCSPDTASATSVLSIEYLKTGSATLKKSEVTVEWQHLGEKGWMITSPPPTLR